MPKTEEQKKMMDELGLLTSKVKGIDASPTYQNNNHNNKN